MEKIIGNTDLPHSNFFKTVEYCRAAIELISFKLEKHEIDVEGRKESSYMLIGE